MKRWRALGMALACFGATMGWGQPTEMSLYWSDTTGVPGTRDTYKKVAAAGSNTIATGTRWRFYDYDWRIDARVSEFAPSGAQRLSYFRGQGRLGANLDTIRVFGDDRFVMGVGFVEQFYYGPLLLRWRFLNYQSIVSFPIFDGTVVDAYVDGDRVYSLLRDQLNGADITRFEVHGRNAGFLYRRNIGGLEQMRPYRFIRSGSFLGIIGTARQNGATVFFRLNIDRSGVVAGLKTYAVPQGFTLDKFIDIDQGSNGEVGLVASLRSPSNPFDSRGLVMGWNASGFTSWMHVVDDLGDRTSFTSVRVSKPNSLGSVVVAAAGNTWDGEREVASPYACAFSPTGNPLWIRSLAQSSTDQYRTIAFSPDGKVFVGGQSAMLGGPYAIVHELNRTTGNLEQGWIWGTQVPGSHIIESMVFDDFGDLHAVGTTNIGVNEDGLVLRFIRPPVAVNDNYTVTESSRFEFDPRENDLGFPDGTVEVLFPPIRGSLINRGDAFLYVPQPGYLGPDFVTYEINRGPYSSTARVQLNVVRGPISLTLGKGQMAGQNLTNGKVLLSGVAGPGGHVVNLSTNSSFLSCSPTSLTIAAGSQVGTFAVRSTPVNDTTVCVVTATSNGLSQTRSITLVPLAPSAFAFTPSAVVGGNFCSARLVLNGLAGPSTVVVLESQSAFCSFPGLVSVPMGSPQVTFPVQTFPVTSPQGVVLSAGIDGRTKTGYFTIVP